MYFVILIGLFILKANGIIIPNIAFILTFIGLGLSFLRGFLQELKEQKKQRIEQKTEYLSGYFDGIVKKK